MGQHILRNAGAAAKENGLGHTFQYLGENNEGHRADNSRKQLCTPAEFELPYQKNQNRQPDTGCGAKALHKMVCKEIIVLIPYTLSENPQELYI